MEHFAESFDLWHTGKKNWNESSLGSTKKKRKGVSLVRDRYHATVKTPSVWGLAFLLIAFCSSLGQFESSCSEFDDLLPLQVEMWCNTALDSLKDISVIFPWFKKSSFKMRGVDDPLDLTHILSLLCRRCRCDVTVFHFDAQSSSYEWTDCSSLDDSSRALLAWFVHILSSFYLCM